MNLNIKGLIVKESELKAQLKVVQDGIEALRSLCEHNWVYDGHGHNESCYRCTRCEKVEWR